MRGLALDRGGTPLKRTALMRLPRALVLAAAALFTLSLLGTLVALGIFFWYDTDFWYFFDVGPVLMVAALILSGFSVSSGVLFIHFRSKESSLTFDSPVFRRCCSDSRVSRRCLAPTRQLHWE